MKYLEVIRHSIREKTSPHLSQAGVELARKIGEKRGPFDRVVTSTHERAVETAIAMGFAVDTRMELLSTMGGEVDSAIFWDSPYSEFAATRLKSMVLLKYCDLVAGTWEAIVKTLPDGGKALIVTHGGVIQAGAAGCLPDADFKSWGGPPSYCEGVRLSYDGEKFAAAEALKAV